jgi:hypothetical protein
MALVSDALHFNLAFRKRSVVPALSGAILSLPGINTEPVTLNTSELPVFSTMSIFALKPPILLISGKSLVR